MHKWFIGLSILLGSLSGVLFTGSYVSAATEFDGYIQTTTLENFKPCKARDLTFDMGSYWGAIVTQRLQYMIANNIDPAPLQPGASATEALDWFQSGSGYVVTQTKVGSSNNIDNIKVVIHHPDTAFSFGHKTTYPAGGSTRTQHHLYNSLEEDRSYTVYISSQSSNVSGYCTANNYSDEITDYLDWAYENIAVSSLSNFNPTGNQNNSLTYYGTGGGSATNNDYFLLIASDSITYPTDYEGEEIPDTHTPPGMYRPRIEIVTVIDWKITLKDNNFITLEEYPFTCNEDKIPLIQYELYNTNNATPGNELDNGTYAANEVYEFQAEDYGVETEFVFLARYTCGDGAGEQTFTTITTKYINVGESGFYLLPTDDCFSDSFPFVDMNGCMNVIKGVLGNLSFGAIQFADWSINTGECHTLGTIGNWLNIPSHSRTICPKFTPEVRNIVTPFLTFVLGITIMGALVTKSRHDTH